MAVKVQNNTVIYEDRVVQVGAGTTAQRPSSPQNGMIRYNTTEQKFEGYADGEWGVIDSGVLYVEKTSSIGAALIPSGTTPQRPSSNLQTGMLRFNTDNDEMERFDGSQWGLLSSGIDLLFLTTSISTGSWSRANSSSPWIATNTVNGVLSTDRPIVDLDLSSVSFSSVDNVRSNWGLVYRVEASGNNEIKFYATFQPTTNFNVSIKIIRET